jgi:hypothetical protein
MLASYPASILNQISRRVGKQNRLSLNASRSRRAPWPFIAFACRMPKASRPTDRRSRTVAGKPLLKANADIIRQVSQQARAWQQLCGSTVKLNRPLLATSADAERAIGVAG